MTGPADLSIVLHAHLPWVRHPQHERHLEEMWFFEAMHETYLPLLQMLDRLDADDVDGKLTVSLSPPLLAMMDDNLLVDRFVAHLQRLIEFSQRDIERTRGGQFKSLAPFYHRRFTELHDYFVDDLNGDAISAFGAHADAGRLELMTCVGTHPILPFQATDQGKRAQIRVGIDEFKRHFGARPKGIWIAECAFAPGVDELLADEGICFACLEETAITRADAAPVFGTYAPVISPGDVAFFGRDPFAGSQVWSADQGYPGDPVYREFYRDRGYELPLDQLDPIIHPDGIRHDTGLKYYRITGDVKLDDKQPYDPEAAQHKVREHARHFVDSRRDQIGVVSDSLADRPVHITCPYDAELFGHWWFEGPLFLEEVFRQADAAEGIELSTPVDYLNRVDIHQQTTPATSTWGDGGYFAVWLDESNAWIYRHLRNAEQRMVQLAQTHSDAEGAMRRALVQAARELMLAQASDWPFIIRGETTVEYAEQRLVDHLKAFGKLAEMIDDGDIDIDIVDRREHQHGLFPDIEPDYWSE